MRCRLIPVVLRLREYRHVSPRAPSGSKLLGEYFAAGSASKGGLDSDHTLHVVITGDVICIDWDRNGKEVCNVDGSASHTHDPARSLEGFEWFYKGKLVAEGETIKVNVDSGKQKLQLKIIDDIGDSLASDFEFEVDPPEAISGVYETYYPGETDLRGLPPKARFGGLSAAFELTGNTPVVDNADFIVRMVA